MQRVLIVEDEVLVRVGLKNSVRWAEYDMQVIADVGNGQQGWEVYTSRHPDIVITDLKMPVLGGMDLIEMIRRQDDTTKIIILTCIEEFSLARQAVSLHVTDYICKFSMTIPELEKVLRRLHEEDITPKIPVDGIVIRQNDKDAIREKVLKGQIFYNIYDTHAFENYIKSLKLRVTPENMMIAIMWIDDHLKLSQVFNDQQGQLTKLSILNVLEDLMTDYPYSEIFQHQQYQYVFLIGLGAERDITAAAQGLRLRFEKIQNTMYQYFNIRTTFGVSHIYNGYENFGHMFEEATQALEGKFYAGASRIIQFGTTQETAEKEFELLRQIPRGILPMDEVNARKFEDRLLKLTHTSVAGIRELVCESLLWFVFSVGRNPEEFSTLLVASTQAIQAAGSIKDIIAVCGDFAGAVRRQIHENCIASPEIERAVQYIRQNYAVPMQLADIAGHVGLNANYFSTLFKKETGSNFVDYLNELRIEKAKRLLIETNHRMIDIAQMVGFTEDSYFSRIFKRVEGKTPNEFRKRMLESWKETGHEKKS